MQVFDGKTQTSLSVTKLTAHWIRWLPFSIIFFGLAFVGWTVVMLLIFGSNHGELTAIDRRVQTLERDLVQLNQQHDFDYWSRECRTGFLELPTNCPVPNKVIEKP